MGSAIARILVWLIPGWVIFESIRECNKLFGLSLNPYLAIFPTALTYVFQEIVVRRWRADDEDFSPDRRIKPKLDRLLYFLAWIFFASLLIAILALWAGSIYKQVVTSYDSYNSPMQ